MAIIQGDLAEYALPDLLQFMHATRKAGQLVLEDSSATAAGVLRARLARRAGLGRTPRLALLLLVRHCGPGRGRRASAEDAVLAPTRADRRRLPSGSPE